MEPESFADPGPETPAPDVEVTAEFFVTISKKSRFRRLHKFSGSCGVIPGLNVAEFEAYSSLFKVQYDDYCHRCWKVAPDFREAESVTSSGSSSDEL